jgi:Ca2+-binding EF-hand superfamily protein
MSRYTLMFASLAMTLSLSAHAQEAKPTTPFENADQNGDGKISQEEYRNRAAYLFHDYDRNDDGVLTPDELPEYRNAEGKIVPPQSVTIQDYIASVLHSFEMADVNKDGLLSPSEWGLAPSMNK